MASSVLQIYWFPWMKTMTSLLLVPFLCKDAILTSLGLWCPHGPATLHEHLLHPIGLQQPHVCACLFAGALLTLLMLTPHTGCFPMWTPWPVQGLAPGHHWSMLCPMKVLSLLCLTQLLCLYLVRKNKGKKRKPDLFPQQNSYLLLVFLLDS